MKRSLFALCMCLSPMAAAAAEFEDYRQKFVGAWQVKNDDRQTDVTWRADGTWQSRTTEKDVVLFEIAGVWWAKDDKLHGVSLSSTHPRIELGEIDTSVVLAIGEKSYTIKSRRGIRVTYHKVK